MKVGLVAASLVLVAGSATACSNSASKEEFCDGYAEFVTALFSSGGEDNIEALKDAAEEFGEVGVPDDIPDDAKDGYELFLDAVADLDDDTTPEELAELEGDFSEEEQKNSDAFQEYLSKTCPDALGG